MPATFSDIFNPTSGQSFGGAFKAQNSTLQFGTIGGVGLLVQNLSFQYTQQITKVYELTSSAVYLIVGRAAGQASINRIVGPTRLNLAFIRQFADACQAANNNPTFSGVLACNSADAGTKTSWKLFGCVIQTIGISVGAQDMMINEAMQMSFISLDIVER